MSETGRAVLADFLSERCLLAFDYDGTLAPIVTDRRQAIMRNSTRMALAQLARRRPVTVITGRSRQDVLSFLVGVEIQEVIGNHGLEDLGMSGARFVARVREWHAELDERMEAIQGLEIEDKRHSLAIHFRNCRDKDHARGIALRVAEHLEGVRIVCGKDVVNLVPDEAPDKGQALLAAMGRLDLPRAIFVGDDDTDEDVFALPAELPILRVRVGRSDQSAAPYYIRDQGEMDSLLSRLGSVPVVG